MQRRISDYIFSTSADMASGVLFDFGDDERITTGRLAQSLNQVLFSTFGGTEKIMPQAMSALRKSMPEKYGSMSDEDLQQEVRKIIDMEKGYVIDYSHPDEEKIALQRSPNGFGQFVVAKNVAREMDAINEAILGRRSVDRNAVIVGHKDREVLSGSDMDADQVKILTGELVPMFEKTIERARQM